ncbi:GIY-YIG nuclease family protein [Pseudoalteromonas xiamenensis]|uniref:GIY-YIG nuclease family protein n=1 Tax=Pseudoalteromonas xiamenensis TaxID=882626 RepID=A0A975DJA6_9GAMM|nr:GIY-YIG nuclease family protein [Pseudoalteromonas xiamenensis]QTH71331.1 GIY-YIG nuclease family protein [Pseudoalteromonas xiamenensis]
MSEEKAVIWSLYIVETATGIWYTGITPDVEMRIAKHESGKGAKSLRGKGPLKLIFQKVVGSKSEAAILEYKVKRLTKAKKRLYVSTCGATIESISSETA